MPPKPKRSWSDVQMAIMTISMASTLGMWNLFASPDRETALRKAAEAQASQPEPVALPPTPEQVVVEQSVSVSPLPAPGEKIMLGGSAPQTKVVIQNKKKDNGGGGGGGGDPVTSTSSS